ncbi:hypothetical protein PM082_006466 [Marasmius tenuissimus]|nr:hypothetical protein PM082_006466 [Marasmius tenuissimus]
MFHNEFLHSVSVLTKEPVSMRKSRVLDPDDNEYNLCSVQWRNHISSDIPCPSRESSRLAHLRNCIPNKIRIHVNGGLLRLNPIVTYARVYQALDVFYARGISLNDETLIGLNGSYATGGGGRGGGSSGGTARQPYQPLETYLRVLIHSEAKCRPAILIP